MSSDDGDISTTRRYLLQTGAAGLATAVAGCTGGDSNSQGTETTTDTNNTTTDTGPDYSLPESEHVDTVELVSQWGNNFPEANRLILDSYSPEQVENKTGVSPIMDETSGTQYQMFDWGPWVIPETVVQSADGSETGTRVRTDQLPGDVTEEGVIEDLRNDGYVERGQRDGFTIMSNRTKQEARAVGNGYHVLSYNVSSSERYQDSNEWHMEVINEALDAYSTGGAQPGADVMDHTEVLDIKDTFGALVRREEDPQNLYIGGPGPTPLSGASTLDIDENKFYASWKFENSDEAKTVKEFLSSETNDYTSGYDEVTQEGAFVVAESPPDENKFFSGATPKPTTLS